MCKVGFHQRVDGKSNVGANTHALLLVHLHRMDRARAEARHRHYSKQDFSTKPKHYSQHYRSMEAFETCARDATHELSAILFLNGAPLARAQRRYWTENSDNLREIPPKWRAVEIRGDDPPTDAASAAAAPDDDVAAKGASIADAAA